MEDKVIASNAVSAIQPCFLITSGGTTGLVASKVTFFCKTTSIYSSSF